jgi:hypothetical protein
MISLTTIALTAFALLLFFIARVVLSKMLNMNTRLESMEKAINSQLSGDSSIDATIEQKLETKLELMRKKALEQYADMREKMTKQAVPPATPAPVVAPPAAAPSVSTTSTFPVIPPPTDEPRAPIRKIPNHPIDVTQKIRRVLPNAPIRIEEPVSDTDSDTGKPAVEDVDAAQIEEIQTPSSQNEIADDEAKADSDTALDPAPDLNLGADPVDSALTLTDEKVKVERSKRRKKV